MKKRFVIVITFLVSFVLTAASFAQTYYPFPDTGQTKCSNILKYLNPTVYWNHSYLH